MPTDERRCRRASSSRALLELGAATLGESGAPPMRSRIGPVWSGRRRRGARVPGSVHAGRQPRDPRRGRAGAGGQRARRRRRRRARARVLGRGAHDRRRGARHRRARHRRRASATSPRSRRTASPCSRTGIALRGRDEDAARHRRPAGDRRRRRGEPRRLGRRRRRRRGRDPRRRARRRARGRAGPRRRRRRGSSRAARRRDDGRAARPRRVADRRLDWCDVAVSAAGRPVRRGRWCWWRVAVAWCCRRHAASRPALAAASVPHERRRDTAGRVLHRLRRLLRRRFLVAVRLPRSRQSLHTRKAVEKSRNTFLLVLSPKLRAAQRDGRARSGTLRPRSRKQAKASRRARSSCGLPGCTDAQITAARDAQLLDSTEHAGPGRPGEDRRRRSSDPAASKNFTKVDVGRPPARSPKKQRSRFGHRRRRLRRVSRSVGVDCTTLVSPADSGCRGRLASDRTQQSPGCWWKAGAGRRRRSELGVDVVRQRARVHEPSRSPRENQDVPGVGDRRRASTASRASRTSASCGHSPRDEVGRPHRHRRDAAPRPTPTSASARDSRRSPQNVLATSVADRVVRAYEVRRRLAGEHRDDAFARELRHARARRVRRAADVREQHACAARRAGAGAPRARARTRRAPRRRSCRLPARSASASSSTTGPRAVFTSTASASCSREPSRVDEVRGSRR